MHLRRTLLNMHVEFQDWRASVVVKLIFFRVMVVTSLLKRVYCAERERDKEHCRNFVASGTR